MAMTLDYDGWPQSETITPEEESDQLSVGLLLALQLRHLLTETRIRVQPEYQPVPSDLSEGNQGDIN